LLNGPGHLELFPIHRAVLPVWCRSTLKQDIAIQLSLFEHIGTSAGWMRLIPHLPLFVPLRLAEHGHIRSARVVKQHIEADVFTVHDDLMIVDDLDAIHHAHAVAVAREGWVFPAWIVIIAPQGMVVHHILGGELAIAVMELYALLQLEVPRL